MTDAPASFNLADIWEWAAARVPDRDALVVGPARRTYRELDERANRLAHHLRAAGIGPGDRVALDLRNGQSLTRPVQRLRPLRVAAARIALDFDAAFGCHRLSECRYAIRSSRIS